MCIRDSPYGEFVTSNALLIPNRWTFIAITYDGTRMKLLINGIVDGFNITDGKYLVNEYPITIGVPDPLKDLCRLSFWAEEFRFYNRAVSDIELEAEMSLHGIEPSYFKLGCVDCTLDEALKSCLEGYHICTRDEILTGGFQLARRIGWTERNRNIWSSEAVNEDYMARLTNDTLGLGLCCNDILWV
eukprot:TRINITY_DN5655_c0_g1_i4.p1 TRINITY_DN5655_c0_g1~~TRINITY_DN5655_c0_g1_i4.p1  ORF type:complete len:187 (-),score=32.38 TRINITY_DN5655_c0_g1_i4:11-571(-)